MSAPFTTDRDLAAHLGKSLGFVQAQCRSKAWPHLRVGKSYRFTDAHVNAIASLLEVAAKTPESQAATGTPAAQWGLKEGRRVRTS